MNPRRWLHEHSLKLLAIRDTPEAIAGGIAIGIFFGFTPLFGLKTLSAILVAWLTGSNILAAVLAGSLHDVIFWLMPAIYFWEYEVGFWLLSHPHHLPPPWLWRENFSLHAWLTWSNFLVVGKPMLLGSLVCGGPFSVLTFFVAKRLVGRHQKKKRLQEAPPESFEPNPS